MDKSFSLKSMRGSRTPHCVVKGLRLSSRALDVAGTERLQTSTPVKLEPSCALPSFFFCEPWAKDRSRPKLTVPHCVTWSSGRYRCLKGEGVCHDSSDSQLSLPQGLSTTPGNTCEFCL